MTLVREDIGQLPSQDRLDPARLFQRGERPGPEPTVGIDRLNPFPRLLPPASSSFVFQPLTSKTKMPPSRSSCLRNFHRGPPEGFKSCPPNTGPSSRNPASLEGR